MIKYLKMLIPIFGKFTNTYYDIIGVIWIGKVIGICIKTKYSNIIQLNSFVIINQYHLTHDNYKKPQFIKK